MSFKFSLRDLFILIGLSSVACAALANTGIWWHSLVVTATLTGMTGIIIWGTLHGGSRSAFACGWLLFASAYLTMVFGPWLGEHLGGNFITNNCLAELESRAFANKPSPTVFGSMGQVDFRGDLSIVVGSKILSSSYPTGFVDLLGIDRVHNITTFRSTGHWLFASVFGYCGAHLAALLFSFRQKASPTLPTTE
jgi:hypothetical protein